MCQNERQTKKKKREKKKAVIDFYAETAIYSSYEFSNLNDRLDQLYDVIP